MPNWVSFLVAEALELLLLQLLLWERRLFELLLGTSSFWLLLGTSSSWGSSAVVEVSSVAPRIK